MKRPTSNINVMCPAGEPDIFNVWIVTAEFIELKNAYVQGFIAVAADIDSEDNPYERMTAEFCYWNTGYEFALRKKIEKCPT